MKCQEALDTLNELLTELRANPDLHGDKTGDIIYALEEYVIPSMTHSVHYAELVAKFVDEHLHAFDTVDIITADEI